MSIDASVKIEEGQTVYQTTFDPDALEPPMVTPYEVESVNGPYIVLKTPDGIITADTREYYDLEPRPGYDLWMRNLLQKINEQEEVVEAAQRRLTLLNGHVRVIQGYIDRADKETSDHADSNKNK